MNPARRRRPALHQHALSSQHEIDLAVTLQGGRVAQCSETFQDDRVQCLSVAKQLTAKDEHRLAPILSLPDYLDLEQAIQGCFRLISNIRLQKRSGARPEDFRQ